MFFKLIIGALLMTVPPTITFLLIPYIADEPTPTPFLISVLVLASTLFGGIFLTGSAKKNIALKNVGQPDGVALDRQADLIVRLAVSWLIAGNLILHLSSKNFNVSGLMLQPEKKVVASCSIRRNYKQSENSTPGMCSYLLFSNNNGRMVYFSKRTDSSNECFSSVESACDSYCGKLTESQGGNAYVSHIKVNFSPEEDFNSFHWPWSKGRSLSLAECKDSYVGKRQLIETPNF